MEYDSIDALLSDLGYGASSFGDSVGSFFDNYGGIAAAGLGGLLGAFGGGSGSGGGTAQITGYQGGIPRYTASRQFTAPPADRVPGSAGYNYFSDVVFTPTESAPPADNTTPPTSTAPPSGGNYVTYDDLQRMGVNINTGSDVLAGQGAAAGGYVRKFAAGGIGSLGSYSDGGRMLKGPGTGQSDDIPATIEDKQPARLARDEFVIPADVVSMLGDGSSDAGAERLYAMMDRIRKMAHGKTKQQSKINPNKALPA
jgi:hypothetical protein